MNIKVACTHTQIPDDEKSLFNACISLMLKQHRRHRRQKKSFKLTTKGMTFLKARCVSAIACFHRRWWTLRKSVSIIKNESVKRMTLPFGMSVLAFFQLSTYKSVFACDFSLSAETDKKIITLLQPLKIHFIMIYSPIS